MIKRFIESELHYSVREFPITGIVGPRQIGKTTLVRNAVLPQPSIYLDLERNSDLNKLNEPELFLSIHADKTVILDEIQHKPELFPLLRSLVDEERRPGRFVILGSASPELLRQSSESLAGRINYLEVFPLNLLEITNTVSLNDLWLNGGYPDPALSPKPKFIRNWYRSFIQSYVQRDLPLYGLPANPMTTTRLLQMIASSNGAILNYSSFGKSLGLSTPTIKSYINFLASAYMISFLTPWYSNSKKRMVKSSKIYFRDNGMLHYLLGIRSYDELLGNISVGNSWEGFVMHQIRALLESDDELYFYRTQDGAEIDLLIRRNNKWLAAIEIKLTNSPSVSKGTYLAMEDLGLDELHVITPSADTYPLSPNVLVISLENFLKKLSLSEY
uniref:ATP-binding protein n=1 Tax=Fulvivirga sp. TaxID=1931237 RepID=UPI00404B5BDB